jgi:hypothetical protein
LKKAEDKDADYEEAKRDLDSAQWRLNALEEKVLWEKEKSDLEKSVSSLKLDASAAVILRAKKSQWAQERWDIQQQVSSLQLDASAAQGLRADKSRWEKSQPANFLSSAGH